MDTPVGKATRGTSLRFVSKADRAGFFYLSITMVHLAERSGCLGLAWSLIHGEMSETSPAAPTKSSIPPTCVGPLILSGGRAHFGKGVQ